MSQELAPKDQSQELSLEQMKALMPCYLETFLDAAFAFATTMLVISIGDIPSSYAELIEALKGTPAFAMSFAAIMIFWLGHRR